MSKICNKFRMCLRTLSLGKLRLEKLGGASKGFSLIEMLVAMTIFMVFTGILISSYIGIVKALQSAEEYRVLYADARHVFDVITETARNSTIYPKENLPCNDVAYANSQFSNSLPSLEFCSKDGLTKVAFEYEEGMNGVDGNGSPGKLIMKKYSRDNVNPDFSFVQSEETKLYSDSIRIIGFHFYVWPLKDPFAVSTYGDSSDLSNLFQPKVTFAATFERDNSKGGIYSIDLQTSVSLRVYN